MKTYYKITNSGHRKKFDDLESVKRALKSSNSIPSDNNGSFKILKCEEIEIPFIENGLDVDSGKFLISKFIKLMDSRKTEIDFRIDYDLVRLGVLGNGSNNMSESQANDRTNEIIKFFKEFLLDFINDYDESDITFRKFSTDCKLSNGIGFEIKNNGLVNSSYKFLIRSNDLVISHDYVYGRHVNSRGLKVLTNKDIDYLRMGVEMSKFNRDILLVELDQYRRDLDDTELEMSKKIDILLRLIDLSTSVGDEERIMYLNLVKEYKSILI